MIQNSFFDIPAIDPIKQTLSRVFGFDSFRGPQEKIVRHVFEGEDALVLMPTGGGKSLCYQIPSLVRAGTGVIISPLISLMQDQVEFLRSLDLNAYAYNSTLTLKKKREIEQELREGKVDFLYLSPERLALSYTLDLLDSIELSLFAIDEAHCVSKWGHDFRPDYRHLSVLKKRYPSTPCLALTATADKDTRADIVSELGLKKAKVFLGSFDRKNIYYAIEEKKRLGTTQLESFLNHHEGESGIVYCLSRRKVEETALFLQNLGFNAYAYHAGLPTRERQVNQQKFLEEDNVIMVATVAFGMGIDKPDVRFVVHMNLPKNVENFYQETGRAGRDGKPAEALLLYNKQDFVTLKRMLLKGRGNKGRAQFEIQSLEGMLALAESRTCIRQVTLQTFDEDYRGPCGHCGNCLRIDKEKDTMFDATAWVRNLLTLYYKMKTPMNSFALCDMARGLVTQQARSNGFFELEEFAFAMNENEKGVLFGINQCLAYGLFKKVDLNKGTLALTKLAADVLKEKTKIYFSISPKQYGKSSPVKKTKVVEKRSKKVISKKNRRKKVMTAKNYPKTTTSSDLFSFLKEVRRSESKKRRVPAFKILHDQSLLEICDKKPRNHEEFLEVKGVGEVKAKKFAKIFIKALDEFDSSL